MSSTRKFNAPPKPAKPGSVAQAAPGRAPFFHANRGLFARFARFTSRAAGHPIAFALAVLIIAVWSVSGPLFGFSDTWQLAINTGTTIVTFLMVFLIQSTQNREAEAVQLKLDEIIRALEGAHVALLDLEDLTEEELDPLKARYAQLAQRARAELERGHEDTGCPEIDAESEEAAAGKGDSRPSTAGKSNGGSPRAHETTVRGENR